MLRAPTLLEVTHVAAMLATLVMVIHVKVHITCTDWACVGQTNRAHPFVYVCVCKCAFCSNS